MFSFNSSEIWVNYIKQKLKSLNLPQCKIFENENELSEFYKNSAGIDVLCIIKNFKETAPCIVRYKNNEVNKVCSYTEGAYYLNLTKTLNLTNNYYDSYTHKYLGDYLRFLRDFKNLDLMSMYNCYSNNYIESDKYKYFLIPVKYYEKYTLAMTAENIDYAFTYSTDIKDLQALFSNIKKYNTIKGIKFKKPIILNSPIADRTQLSSAEYSYDYFKEKDLCLVLKTRNSFRGTITVLEGDFSKNQGECSNIIINHDKNEKISISGREISLDKAYDYVNIENLININIDLLSPNILDKTTQTPFSSRLFEYLTNNVITDRYSVTSSAIEFKEKAGLDSTSRFSNYDRLTILEKASLNKKDLKGFIDKDVEVKL